MASDKDLLGQLEKKYCPPLDTATFLAIVGDYDLENLEHVDAARQTLDALTKGVEEEEGSGFDPSGSGGSAFPLGCDDVNTQSESGRSVPTHGSSTDDSSLSQGLSVLDIEDLDSRDMRSAWDREGVTPESGLGGNHHAQMENLDMASKEAVLIETFPGLKAFDIKWTLQKCKGDADVAIDELLNQVFLEESGGRRRGIEGFSEDSHQASSRKLRGKKRRLRLAAASDVESPPPDPSSMWENTKKDVEFISSRIGMPISQVTSIHYKNGASLRATISAIIDAHLSLQLDTRDLQTQRKGQELLRDFPSVSLPHLIALIQLSEPSMEFARDLAKALTTRSTARSGSHPPIHIEIRLPRPDLTDAAPDSGPRSRSAAALSETSSSPSPATRTAAEYAARRDAAFAQASLAYRRGRSDALMAGAAAHYASVGRDWDARAQAATAAEADRLVARQSAGDSSSALDLHGVDVRNAERISRQRVTDWWARLGGPRGEAVGLHGGYRIVTGRGRHSEGGRSRLGPAVAKMLISEGWKVEVGCGVLTVTGVVARR
ncbi:MAG: hypothetical protein M1818_003301 [Claussenomyces sp. TS43310]|nr:MAG: hypothetical protein M1818_003301 [Claussenomyces sp. TS43310]